MCVTQGALEEPSLERKDAQEEHEGEPAQEEPHVPFKKYFYEGVPAAIE